MIVSLYGMFQEIMFLAVNIILFIYIHSVVASKYYYKEVNGKYDIYYGNNADCGYKEFRPPKSYKMGHKDRGERPGKCIKSQFECTSPYSVKETKFFECEVDFQCPNLFKCCEVHCFQHKICQPIELKEIDDGEISYDDDTTEVTTKDVFTDNESTKSDPTTQFTTHSTKSDTTQFSTTSISSTEETSQNTLSSEQVFTTNYESTTFNPSTKYTVHSTESTILQSSTTLRSSSFRTTRSTTEKPTPITLPSHRPSQSTTTTDDEDKSTDLSSLYSTQSSTELDKSTPTTTRSTTEKIASPSDPSSQSTTTTDDDDKSTELSSIYSTQSSTEFDKTTPTTTMSTTEKITSPSDPSSQSTTTTDDNDKSTELSSLYPTQSSTELDKTTPTTTRSTTEKITSPFDPSSQSTTTTDDDDKSTELSSLYPTESSTELDETTHAQEKLTSTTTTSIRDHSSESTFSISRTTSTWKPSTSQTTTSITKTSERTTITGSPIYTTRVTTQDSDETTTEKATSIHSTLTVTNTEPEYTSEVEVTTTRGESVTSNTHSVTTVAPTTRTTTYSVPITSTDASETSLFTETSGISSTIYPGSDITHTDKTTEDVLLKQSTFTTASPYSDSSQSTVSQSSTTQPSTVMSETTSSNAKSSTPQNTKISTPESLTTFLQTSNTATELNTNYFTTSKPTQQTPVQEAKESTILESTISLSTSQPQSTVTEQTIVTITSSPVYSETTRSHSSSTLEHVTSSSTTELVTKPQTSSSEYSNTPELSTITTSDLFTKYTSTPEVTYAETSDQFQLTRAEYTSHTTDITSDDEDDITSSGDFGTNTILESESTQSSATKNIVTSGSLETTEPDLTVVFDTSEGVTLTTQSHLTSQYSDISSLPTIKSSTGFTNPTSKFPSDSTLTQTQSSPSKSEEDTTKDITSDDEDLTFSGDFEVSTTNSEQHSTLYIEDRSKATTKTVVSSTFEHTSNTYSYDQTSLKTPNSDAEIRSSDKPVGFSTQEYLKTTETTSSMFTHSDTPKQTDILKQTTPFQIINKSTSNNNAESFTTTSVDKFTSAVSEPNNTPLDVTGDDEDLAFSGDGGSGSFDGDTVPEMLSTIENESYKSSKVTQVTTTDDDFSFNTESDHKQEVPESLLKLLTGSTEEKYVDITRTTLEINNGIKSTSETSYEFVSSTEEVTLQGNSEPTDTEDKLSSPASKVTTINSVNSNCKENAKGSDCVTTFDSELFTYNTEKESLPTLTTKFIVEVEN